METYFNIRYEFDKIQVLNNIDQQLRLSGGDYICVADGNITANVQNSPKYRDIVNDGMFSICDGSWTPIFLRFIYGIKRESYTGSQIFEDIIKKKKYRVAFLGGTKEALKGLSTYLEQIEYDSAQTLFMELPYKKVEDFDYNDISKKLNSFSADIIWVGLGAPKQEQFMYHLKPYLTKGVMIGVGAVFNFYGSSNVRRAPRMIRNLHFEFLYRLLSEPRRQIPKFHNYIKTLPKIILTEYKNKKKRQ